MRKQSGNESEENYAKDGGSMVTFDLRLKTRAAMRVDKSDGSQVPWL